MSINFIASQIKIPRSHAFGKWYAKMVRLGNVSTEQLAREISHSSCITEADVTAVLYALSHVIRLHLLQSETVHLHGLGTLRVSIRSHMVEKAEDVNESLIYNYKIIFNSDKSLTRVGAGPNGGHSGFYTKELIKGVKAKPL